MVGANIISQVPFPYPVAPLVLSHHERWDGRGYPNGLRGDTIPLGARILSVVDCFTSMLTERPYRPSHTYAEAIATLRENRGSTLDPDLVEKFIEILPAVETQLHQSQAVAKGAAEAPAPTGAATALADIVVARREEQILREMGQSLSASLQVSDALSLISTKLVSMMPLDACALFRLEPTSGLFMCSHVVGSHQDAIRSVTAASVEGLGAALPTSTPSVLGAPSRLQSMSVAPLVTDAGTIGALAVYHVDRNVYTTDDRRLLARVASHAANVIASALVFEQTQEQSLTDVLTGLPNRRYLDSHLAQEVARVRRHGGQLSILVLDMDGFKQINDEFGHQAGDGALREVSQVLRASLRVYDVCARFAGDEFVLVLGDCDPAQAERRRADLQRAIAAIWIEPIPGRIVSLSVSVGAATFPDDADTVDGVLSVADRRMYRDKGDRKRLGPGHGRPDARLPLALSARTGARRECWYDGRPDRPCPTSTTISAPSPRASPTPSPSSTATGTASIAITFGELAALACQAAATLAGLGVGAGDRCAILAENHYRWFAAYLGTLRLGAVAVPLDTAYSASQVGTVIRDSAAKVLMVSPRYLDVAREAAAASAPGPADPAALGVRRRGRGTRAGVERRRRASGAACLPGHRGRSGGDPLHLRHHQRSERRGADARQPPRRAGGRLRRDHDRRAGRHPGDPAALPRARADRQPAPPADGGRADRCSWRR